MSQKVQGRLASASTMPAHQAKCETPNLIHKQAQCGRAGLSWLSLSKVGQGRGGAQGGCQSHVTLPFSSCAKEQLQQQQLVLSNWPAELKADSLFLSSSI